MGFFIFVFIKTDLKLSEKLRRSTVINKLNESKNLQFIK